MKSKVNVTFEGSVEEFLNFLNDTFKEPNKLHLTVTIGDKQPPISPALKELQRLAPYIISGDLPVNTLFTSALERSRVGDKIGSIKLIRELSGLGLAEAKNYVESRVFVDAYNG